MASCRNGWEEERIYHLEGFQTPRPEIFKLMVERKSVLSGVTGNRLNVGILVCYTAIIKFVWRRALWSVGMHGYLPET
jgi:hypothetical protein